MRLDELKPALEDDILFAGKTEEAFSKPLRWCRKNTREVNVPKNPFKPCQNPQFSDVIELAGNSGIPQAFNHFFNLKPVAKERDHTITAKLQVQIVIKIDIFEKQPFKTIFSAGVDTISTGTQKRIIKLANGALIAPGIPHVPGISINPYNIPILVVSDILMDPVFGELFQEFSIGQGVIDTKTEPELGAAGIEEEGVEIPLSDILT